MSAPAPIRTRTPRGGPSERPFDADEHRAIRADFPVLVAQPDLAFLDTAASAQKPRPVIEAEADALAMGERACAGVLDHARERAGRFFDVPGELVRLARSATEALNRIARALEGGIGPGDEIAVSLLEHHANLVPWQMLARRTGARLTPLPLTADGAVDIAAARARITARTRVVAVTELSNVTGGRPDLARLSAAARAVGAWVIIDGCQGAAHSGGAGIPPWDGPPCDGPPWDGYVASAHKLYGPSGLGILITGPDLSARLIDAPEGGTPWAQAAGLIAALDWIDAVGRARIAAHEAALRSQLLAALTAQPGCRVLGSSHGDGAVSFVFDTIHAHDVATILDQAGVALRAGHHCCQPLMDHFDVAATARASLGVYSRSRDIDRLADGLRTVREWLG